MGNKLLFFFAVFFLLSGCSRERNIASVYDLEESGEPIAHIDIHSSELDKILSNFKFAGGKFFTSIETDFDPANRRMILRGKVSLPQTVLDGLCGMMGHGTSIARKEVEFLTSIKFPSFNVLALSRYMTFEFEEFWIDGKNLVNFIPIFTSTLRSVIANTEFVDYLLDLSISEQEQNIQITQDVSINLKEEISELLSSKGLIFRGNEVDIKLDFSKFERFAGLKKYSNLRLWLFSPIQLKGTDESFMRIEVGIGKPDKSAIVSHKKRFKQDKKNIEQIREELYQKYTSIESRKKTVKLLRNHLKEGFEKKGFSSSSFKLSKYEQRDYQKFYNAISSVVFDRLNRENNPIFESDPANEYHRFLKEGRGMIDLYLDQLNRKYLGSKKIRQGGKESDQMPFFSMLVSQDALNAAIRYYREFELEKGKNLIRELHVAINPALPGFTIRGSLNIDPNFILNMASKGPEIENNTFRIVPEKYLYEDGVPFETSLRLKMREDAWLGVDVDYFRIFKKGVISKNSRFGDFVFNFVKMAIVNTLAEIVIHPMDADELTEYMDKITESEERIKRNANKLLGEYLLGKKNISVDNLEKYAKINISNSPISVMVEQFLKRKTKLAFSKAIKMDQETGEVLVKMDPRLFVDLSMGPIDQAQIWNMQYIFLKARNQTYMRTDIGIKTRSKKFLQSVLDGNIVDDSVDFTTIDNNKNSSKLDLRARLNLDNFNQTLQQLIEMVAAGSNKQNEELLKSGKAKTVYSLDGISLKATSDNELAINMRISVLGKWRVWHGRYWRNLLARKKGSSWKKTIEIEARLFLKLKARDKINQSVFKKRTRKDEVFFGDQFLSVDISKVKLIGISNEVKESDGRMKERSMSILDRLLKVSLSNLDFSKSGVLKKIKAFIFNKIASEFHSLDPKRNENLRFGDMSFNRYMKLIALEDEILIQLNPYLITPAFDTRLVSITSENGDEKFFVIDKKKNSITFDFIVQGSFANIDKVKLIKTMERTRKKIAPYLEMTMEELQKKLERPGIMDDLFKGDDSIINRFKKVLAIYPELSNFIEIDQGLINRINDLASLNQVVMSHLNEHRLSSSGVGVMFFVSASMILNENIRKFLVRMKKLKGSKNSTIVDIYKRLKILEAEIEKRYIGPLLKLYRVRYEKQNRLISKRITDWNYSFYHDAVYADLTYKFINKNMSK